MIRLLVLTADVLPTQKMEDSCIFIKRGRIVLDFQKLEANCFAVYLKDLVHVFYTFQNSTPKLLITTYTTD